MTALKLVGYHGVPDPAITEDLFTLGRGKPVDMWILAKAYMYGVIMGKLMERARRKRSKQ